MLCMRYKALVDSALHIAMIIQKVLEHVPNRQEVETELWADEEALTLLVNN